MFYTTLNDAAKTNDILAEGNVKIHYVRRYDSEDVRPAVRDLINMYTLSPSLVLEKNYPNMLKSRISDTHIELGSIKGSDDLEDIFTALQGEIWSPEGEARNLIAGKGLTHTSMSMGDIIELEDGRMFLVAMFGFTEIK